MNYLFYKLRNINISKLIKVLLLVLVITHVGFINAQNNRQHQNNHFIITKTGEHGFYSLNDTLYYVIDFELVNNTNYKFKKTTLTAIVNNLYEFKISDDSIVRNPFMPQETVKCELIIYNPYFNSNFKEVFDKTPQKIDLDIFIDAHNIDKDFDEKIAQFNIDKDWKDFQKVLGLRDLNPGENLKIIKPRKIKLVNNTLKKKEQENKSLSYSVSERKLLSLPKPNIRYNTEGKVVVTVTINKQGKVTKAVAGARGSTILDDRMLEAAEKAAMQAQFEASSSGPEYQVGTIIYHFGLQ